MAISSDKILGQNREINQFITRCAGFHFEIAFSAWLNKTCALQLENAYILALL